MKAQGLDYSLGRSNYNPVTGIHFGVISQNAINLDCTSDFEYDYGEPTCPKCGNPVVEIPSHTEQSNPPGQWVSVISDIPPAWEEWEQYTRHGCANYACESCKILLDNEDVYAEESIGWSYESDGYKLTDCLDTDIFIIESPYYTYAAFCSPCVPGACSLESPIEPSEDAVKCYCLGFDWFDEDNPCPYRVFRVADGTEVFPNA